MLTAFNGWPPKFVKLYEAFEAYKQMGERHGHVRGFHHPRLGDDLLVDRKIGGRFERGGNKR